MNSDDRRGGPRGERPRDRLRRGRENRGDSGPDAELPDEMIDRIMQMVKKNLPEAYDRLEQLREKNPDRFRVAIRRMVPPFKEYMMLLQDERPDLAKGIVEEFKNEQRLNELSRDYRDAAAEPDKQAQISQEIETLVRKQMEFHQQRMGYRLEQFEKRIQEQQERLARQRTRFEEEKSKFEERVTKRVGEIKKGELRGPPRRGPGPHGFGDGPPPGPGGRGDGPPRGRRGPDGGPPQRPHGPRAGPPPEGPPPDELPPSPDEDEEDE